MLLFFPVYIIIEKLMEEQRIEKKRIIFIIFFYKSYTIFKTPGTQIKKEQEYTSVSKTYLKK